MRIPCKHCEYMMASINKEATKFHCANCKIIMTVGPMVSFDKKTKGEEDNEM